MANTLNKKSVTLSIKATTVLIGSYKVAQGILKQTNTIQEDTSLHIVAPNEVGFFNQKEQNERDN